VASSRVRSDLVFLCCYRGKSIFWGVSRKVTNLQKADVPWKEPCAVWGVPKETARRWNKDRTPKKDEEKLKTGPTKHLDEHMLKMLYY